jgi:hypothetical protein
MSLHPFTTFSKTNRRLIFLLITGHLLWSCAVYGLWSAGRMIETPGAWWVGGFLALQLYAASQLLLPALWLQAEQRGRGFYLFWALVLVLFVWLINQLTPAGAWPLPLAAFKSGLLLLAATLTGTALARYVRRLWEIVPVCLVMTLADFSSWRYGPTGGFAQEIQRYYQAPEGPPPLIDMILVKLAFPGSAGLAPVFGISDWIMVAFFAVVASRHGVNDNLAGQPGASSARPAPIGRYLPVPVAALFATVVLAQASGLFIPALPLMALIMLIWYAARYLLRQKRPSAGDS